MRRLDNAAIALLLMVAGTSSAYEWRSHNRMAANARAIFVPDPKKPRPMVPVEGDLVNFLRDYGADLDTRAGDEEASAGLFGVTDEDATEGSISMGGDGRSGGGSAYSCLFREAACGPVCTFDHFHPPLPLPLGQVDTVIHARRYLDDAVKLYKAAKCNKQGMAPVYYKWTARALGHAIHLVEDMGSPQHVKPENHLPLWGLGHGPSFHEYWSLHAWDQAVTYTSDGTKFTLGHFEGAAEAASRPRSGKLEGIMDEMASEAKAFPLGSPFGPGQSLTLTELLKVTLETYRNMDWWTGYGLKDFRLDQFPRYGWFLPDGRKPHTYRDAYLLADPDFEAIKTSPPTHGEVKVASFELAERLWAEPDSRSAAGRQNPVVYDAQLWGLLTHTTEAAAGAILAFWDEVKGYNCPCRNFTPCAFRAGSKDPDCNGLPPGPYTPGRDNPDDTTGIVANVSSVKVAAVSQFDAAARSAHWRQIAAVGVEKGLTSLVDFGRTMHLLELSQYTLLDTDQEQLAREVASLERKYSVNIRRPEEDMSRAAHVAILDNGFAGEAGSALDALGWTHTSLPIVFDPLLLAEEQKVLFIPSGGLYGTAGSADLKERFRAYVEAGGTLVVMAQMHGEDFKTVPTPAGEELAAYGWFEDQSCWTDSVRIAAAHPITAALSQGGRHLAVDGYLERWPSQATVLLRKTNGGSAAMVAYPIGAGWVVVSTTFEDWARANGRIFVEGQAMLASLLRWAVDPGKTRPTCHFGTPCTQNVAVTVRNLTESAADTIGWQVLDPEGNRIRGWEERRTIAAGEQTALTEPVNVTPQGWTGIMSLQYCLLDSTRRLQSVVQGLDPTWYVQPWGEAGQIVAESFPSGLDQLPQIGLGVAVDSEYSVNGAMIPVHLSVRNFGAQPFSGTVGLWSVNGGGWDLGRYPNVTIDAAPGATSVYTALIGPVHLNDGHDGLAGGAVIHADAYAQGGTTPLVSAFKTVLNNPTLLNATFRASDDIAGAGDVLHFFGSVANSSPGAVAGRYRVVIENDYSSMGAPCATTKTDWKPFDVAPGGSFALDEPYPVPGGCNGVLFGRLYLCYPGMRCWDSGVEGSAAAPPVAVSLALARADVSLGEFTIAAGPAFRLPIVVRNTGQRPIEQGQIRLNLPGAAIGVESVPFDLARGQATTITLDLPIPPGVRPARFLFGTSFRDRSWAPAPGVPPTWSFGGYQELAYDGGLAALSGFTALPGSDAINGEVLIENRSSASRHFAVNFDTADLGFHDKREYAIGPHQGVTAALHIPLPPPQAFGVWSMAATLSDGALLTQARSINVVHAAPIVQLAAQNDQPSYRVGDVVNTSVELRPGTLARTLPGTLEFTCASLGFTTTRNVALTSATTSREMFSVPIPPTAAPGSYACEIRWLGPNGYVAQHNGKFTVPPARYEAHLLRSVLNAGESAVYEVRNIGGAAGTPTAAWELSDGALVLGRGSATASLAPGASQQISFPIPNDVATGSYPATLMFTNVGELWTKADLLSVTGAAASLTVGTGSPIYTLGQAIDGWARITNGAQGATNATLSLEVRTPLSCEPIQPWGVFQGSSARTGASPRGGKVINGSSCGAAFYPQASLPPGVVPVALAAGDLDEDGKTDVVAVAPAGTGLALGVFIGPGLAQLASAHLSGTNTATSASVGTADTDGDGHLEVYEADSGDGASFVIREYSHTLQALWERPVAASGGPMSPSAAGGPIFADLDGSGRLTVIVSTGQDVIALDPRTGNETWRLCQRSPALVGWVVTGVAAGDVDGDGRGEIVVGFRVVANPVSGALALVDGNGTTRWVVSTTNAVMGSPVIVGSGVAGPSIASVQTPDTSASSSSLLVVDATSGSTRWQTVVPFWSQAGPAVADVNGDGALEYVVTSGDMACAACAPRAVMVFTDQGGLLWQTSAAPPPVGAPILVDVDGDGRPDVVAPVWASGGASLASWTGSTGVGKRASAGPVAKPPLFVVDVNGDCTPEILLGPYALIAGPIPCIAADPGSAPREATNEEVVWRWEGPITLAPAQVWQDSPTLGTKQRTGHFRFVGELKTSLGQTLARAESAFSVVPGTLGIALDPLPNALRAGAQLQLGGTLRNSGAAAVAFDLTFYIDRVATLRRPIVLAAGASQPLVEQLAAPPPGAHILRVEAATSGLSLTVLEATLLVQEPAVTASVIAPPKVGQEAFEVVAKLTNPTQLPLDLEIALDTPGATPSPRERVHLAASENASLIFHRQVAADETFVLTVGGDAANEQTCRVAYDVKPDFKLLGAHTQPAGYAVLPLELLNSGGHPWHGDLLWSLRGPTGLSGTVATNVESGSSARIDIPVSLGLGSWTLHLEAAGVARDGSIEAYANGKGILTLTVPGQAVEGPVSVAVRLENALTTPGEFQFDLDVRNVVDGALVGTIRRVWALDGGQVVVDDFPLDLRAGTFAIGTRLNGEPVPGSQARVQVTPRRAADLAAAVGPPTADGKLPLAVTLRNTGGSELAGTLMVDGLGWTVEVPEIAIAPAGSATRQVLIDPDSLPAGPRPLVLRYASGNGEVLASRDVPFDIGGGTLTLVAAPAGVVAAAGGVTPLEFVIANTGMQTSGYEVTLQLGGGALFAGADKGFLRPGQRQLVRFDVPVPADLPQGEIPMEFALMEAGGTGQLFKTVHTGRTLLKVQSVPVSVTAAVDRDHVLPGEHVQLILSVTAGPGVSSLPLVAKVSYPPFDERRAFTVGAGETQLRFVVPIARPDQELGYGVYFDSGRALHLDAVAIHPAGGGVVIASSKPEYAPGEEVQLVVTLSRPGTLEIYGFGQAASLAGSGTASVHIPEGLPRGQFPVVWTFFGSGPDGRVENGEFRVNVRGPLVRITRLQTSKVGDQRDQTFVVTATIVSDAPITGVAKTWLVTPTGGSTVGTSLQLDVGESGTQNLALRFPADVQEVGTHSCVLGLYGVEGTLLASAATQIDVSGARLLAVQLDRTEYLTLAEPIGAWVDLQGAGSATLVVRVDGRVTSSRPVTVAGVQRLRVPIVGVGPGAHRLSATLDSAGLSSTAEVSFKVGTGLPDLAVEFLGVVQNTEKSNEEETSEGNLGTFDDAAAGKIRILLRVRNVGQTATPETELVTVESGSKKGERHEETEIAPLQPGSDVLVTVGLKHLKAGKHQLTASVDPEGKITEFSETNNVVSFGVTVARPAASSVGSAR